MPTITATNNSATIVSASKNGQHITTAVAATSSTATNSPVTSISGAIKSLTQKYKTLHLNSSNESQSAAATTTAATGHHGTTNGGTNGTGYYKTTYVNSGLHLNSSNTTNGNLHHYNTNAVNGSHHHHHPSSSAGNGHHHHHHHLSNSIDHGLNSSANGTASSALGDLLNSNNSEHVMSSDESKTLTKNMQLANRNSIAATPTQHTKLLNSMNAEWTQMIRINTGKNKSSDLNNNELNSANNNTHSHTNGGTTGNGTTKDHQLLDTASIIHLKHGSTNSNSSTNGVQTQHAINGGSSNTNSMHMPILTYPNTTMNSSMNNSSNSNHSSMNVGVLLATANRLNKSPLAQKLSSPVTLPAIDSVNNGSTSTSVSGTGSSSLGAGRRSGSGSP